VVDPQVVEHEGKGAGKPAPEPLAERLTALGFILLCGLIVVWVLVLSGIWRLP
jgi:hypothetical protein